MPWKIKPVDLSVEKLLLTGLIVSDQFSKRIAPMLQKGFLQSSWTRMVSRWCLDYFERYGVAPNATIRQIYDEKIRAGTIDETGEKIIGEFLSRLSEEYQSGDAFNAPYALDLCLPYLKMRHMRGLCEDIGARLDSGDVPGAEDLVKSFERIESPSTEGIDVFRDKDAIIEAFSHEENVLLEFPGALGELVGPLCRDDFFGIFGPAGRGKSWWLMYMAMLLVLSRIRVLYVSLEMTRSQMLRRLYQCYLGAPRTDRIILNPVADCARNQSNICGMPSRMCRVGLPEDMEWSVIDGKHGRIPQGYIPCTACREKGIETGTYITGDYKGAVWFEEMKRQRIQVTDALKKSNALEKMFPGRLFKLLCFPSRSVTALDLRTHVQNFVSYDGWMPGAILVDYPDILGSISHSEDKRQQINDTWECLRGISQEMHILVGVVSHTRAETFNRDIRQDDQSEDKRKGNHLTQAAKLDQKDAEKCHGVMRIGMLKRREEGFSTRASVTVLQNLAIGKPYIDSFWSPLD